MQQRSTTKETTALYMWLYEGRFDDMFDGCSNLNLGSCVLCKVVGGRKIGSMANSKSTI